MLRRIVARKQCFQIIQVCGGYCWSGLAFSSSCWNGRNASAVHALKQRFLQFHESIRICTEGYYLFCMSAVYVLEDDERWFSYGYTFSVILQLKGHFYHLYA